MDALSELRLRAQACHAEALAATGGDRRAAAIVAALASLRDVEVVEFAPDTRFGEGVLGAYDGIGRLGFVDATLPAGRREVVVAQALGHHELRDDAVELMEEAGAPDGGARGVVRPHDGGRGAAAAFAAELLCPIGRLRFEVVDCGRRPSDVAADLGLPARLVMNQAIRAACLPEWQPGAPAPRAARADALDAAQVRAATWSAGPLMVDAGPGTGKTSTLVARVAHLLASGVPASGIVLLTFSTRAAGELSTRVAETAPDAARSLWTGTIHSFGLEMIHDWHHRVGRGPRPRVLDRDGALELLVRKLDGLPPTRFRDLRDPVAGLAPALRIVERCKAGLVLPEDYSAAAQAAAFDGEGEAASAAVEVAAIYAAFEKVLEAEDAVDLGDLVAVPARLLADHDDIARHYARRFAHVLVDEAQDLDPASTRILEALCGAGSTLWAVGDRRQCVYRFRGASPTGVADLVGALGGATLSLDRSYRATPEIVRSFAGFSASVPGGAGSWTAQRASGPPVRLTTAPTPAGEAAALWKSVEALRATGVGYGSQVVLARTHRTLERVAAGLERHGVPTHYLGDVLARDEVRDLLAVLSLAVEPFGLGLLRVATKPPYGVPRGEVVAVLHWIKDTGTPVARALRSARVAPGVSPASARTLVRLADDLLAGRPSASAWTALASWLFEAHDAAPLAEGAPARRAAVRQLLRLAADDGGGPAGLLRRVRRIASLGAGRELGASAEATSEDAVSLLTVHAAKGAEFAAVHLPGASARDVPLRPRREDHAPLPGLARLSAGPAEHDAEERAGWFVALSRARDHLSISYARRDEAGREARPSPFLSRSGAAAAERSDDPGLAGPTPPLLPQRPRAAHPAGDLDRYARCPARYRYDVVDGLADATPPSGRRATLRAVLAALEEVEAAADRGATPSYADGAAAVAASWAAVGPVGHPHEAMLRRAASLLVERLVEQVAGEAGATRHRSVRWTVPVGAGAVVVTPHRVIEWPWGAVTVQLLGSHRRDLARSAPRTAALSAGARLAFPDCRVTVEVVDVDTGEVAAAEAVDEEGALDRYRDAIARIERGSFPPRPDQRRCPTCPYFLVCGA